MPRKHQTGCNLSRSQKERNLATTMETIPISDVNRDKANDKIMDELGRFIWRALGLRFDQLIGSCNRQCRCIIPQVFRVVASRHSISHASRAACRIRPMKQCGSSQFPWRRSQSRQSVLVNAKRIDNAQIRFCFVLHLA